MPIGLVSDEDFEREIKSYRQGTTIPGGKIEPSSTDKLGPIPTPVVEGEVVDIPKRGRKAGTTAVPDSLRALIGEESVINGRESALQLAKAVGVSPSSVSAYAVGATSTASYDKPKPSIIDHINKSRQRAIKRASHVLNEALGAITQEKLDYTDADKLSGIAKDMSAIIKNLEPPKSAEGGESGKSPQFVIFAPQFRDERTFETITVQE